MLSPNKTKKLGKKKQDYLELNLVDFYFLQENLPSALQEILLVKSRKGYPDRYYFRSPFRMVTVEQILYLLDTRYKSRYEGNLMMRKTLFLNILCSEEKIIKTELALMKLSQ
jgi:hypothetical protein